ASQPAAHPADSESGSTRMNLDHPLVLVSGLFIGLVGMALFMYGKKETNLRVLGVGAVLCVYPYFVSSLLLLWLIAAACIGLLALSAKAGLGHAQLVGAWGGRGGSVEGVIWSKSPCLRNRSR